MEQDAVDLYWPFGFPCAFVIHCKHFARAALRDRLPGSRAPLSLSPVASLPMYTPGVQVTASSASSDSEDEASVREVENSPQKRVNSPTSCSASADICARRLFPTRRPRKRSQAASQQASPQLLPQVLVAAGGSGLTAHLILALVCGSGTHGLFGHRAYRAGASISSRVFSLRKHRVIFPLFCGFSSSVSQSSALAAAIRVLRRYHHHSR
jgi:hypothetical protein